MEDTLMDFASETTAMDAALAELTTANGNLTTQLKQ